MYRLDLAIIIILLLTTPLLGDMRYEYVLHYEMGCAGAIAVWGFSKEALGIREDYGLLSVGIPALLVGIFKEYRDYKVYGRIPRESMIDYSFTVLGAVTGKLLTYKF